MCYELRQAVRIRNRNHILLPLTVSGVPLMTFWKSSMRADRVRVHVVEHSLLLSACILRRVVVDPRNLVQDQTSPTILVSKGFYQIIHGSVSPCHAKERRFAQFVLEICGFFFCLYRRSPNRRMNRLTYVPSTGAGNLPLYRGRSKRTEKESSDSMKARIRSKSRPTNNGHAPRGCWTRCKVFHTM